MAVSLAWYKVGTLSVTNNSAVVTGTGTQFATYIHEGFGIFIEGIGYGIASADSATQITLTENYVGATKANARYSIWPTAALNFQQWRDVVDLVNQFGPLRNDMTLLNQQIADTLGYKNSASASALAASQSAANALASANAAATSATNSANSATAAAGSATAANTSKTAAATSATAAAGSASDANASKQAAATSATAAASSATDAGTAKSASETARDASQTAKTAAEAALASTLTAKGATETARDTAVTAKTAAQTAQTAAEGARDTALTHKNAAASSATAAATSETNAATSKADAQTAKNAAETARDAAVAAKTDAQTAKTDAQTAKTGAETARNAAQQAQAAAELAAGQAQEPVNAGAIEDALGGTPALLSGATFTGPVTVPSNLTVAAQDNNTEGGQIVLKRAPNQGIQGDIVIDTQANNLRIFDNVATGRMLAWDAVNGQLQLNGQYVYHTGNNPSKAAVGLGNVDNTSDAAKPVSTATQTALNLKAPIASPAFTGRARSPAIYIGDATYDRSQNGFELGGGNGSYGIAIQDGQGRVNHYWNSAGGNSPTQTVANEHAFRLAMTSDSTGPSLDFLGWNGSSKAAGAAITWSSIFRAGSDDAAPKFKGQDLYHSGNISTAPVSTATQNALNGKLSLDGSSGMSGTLYSSNQNALVFRPELSAGSKPSAILRNDGSNIYLLLSNASSSATATWNDLRPLTVNTTTGVLRSDNGQGFSGGMTVSGTATFNSPIEGMAWPRRADANIGMRFNWSGQGGQPNWVWGGSDGTNMYVYNPSNFNVASATNCTNVQGIAGGNQGGYTRRSNNAADNGAWSRQLVLSGSDVSYDIWSPPLELREVGLVGSNSTSRQYAPGITFHWSSVAASALKMYPDGSLRLVAQNSTGDNYQNIWAQEHYASGWIRPISATGMYWDAYGRGISVADAGSSYGNITTWGTGKGGWSGYSIGNYAQFMSNGDTTGIYCERQGRWLINISNAGDAVFPGNITAYSDERLKHNKRPIDNVAARREGMAKASMLYERDGEVRVGFGAQTLELAVPEVVKTADDLVGTKSVNYMDMVAILAVDNQQQAEQIEQLQSENAQLRNILAALENRLTKAGI